jgi:non-specific protein-tyrosine kinase
VIKIKRENGVALKNSERPVMQPEESASASVAVEDVTMASEDVTLPPYAGETAAVSDGKKKRRFDFFPKRSKKAPDLPVGEPRIVPVAEHAEMKPKIGWVSPSYTVSRKVTLDPAVLHANRCILHRPQDSVEVDAYRVLRTKILQKCKEKGGNTIMVTSAVPGEGKTLNAVNIAVTLAKEFQQTVLLVDCDLRRQTVHRYFGYESDKGLIDYLLNDTPVSELMTWPGIEKLTVLSGGRPISGGSELLGSRRMKELVEDMKTRYPERYIIFDVPPLLAGADALAFVPLVDHVVVVVREGETPAGAINQAMKLIPPEKVLGLVLNGQKNLSHMVAYSLGRDYSA